MRYREIADEIGGLRELRQVAGRAQADVAAALHIKQPSVSKIEKQADMHLSTLRSYIRAIGGDLELVVRLPSHTPIHLQNLGHVGARASAKSPKNSRRATIAAASERAAKAG